MHLVTCIAVYIIYLVIPPSYTSDGLDHVNLRPPLITMHPVVRTHRGLVRGNKMTSRSGNEYYAFTAIPYAKPPLGQLRFEKPVPADTWEGVRDGPTNLPDCWQRMAFNAFRSNVTFGTEDCLYLSVFTPQVGKRQRLPVMLYIAGGAFRSQAPSVGSSNTSTFLLDEDIVLVTFSFRVSAFGFLSLENEVQPGNMGLKDAVAVLRWVRRNIREFGGDPTRITLFGDSAGGASVQYLLTSPQTKHLFKQGMSQSGASTCLWAFAPPGVGRYRTIKLAEYLKCPTSPEQELLTCLKSKPALDIAEAEQIFIRRDFDPLVPYPPVLEKGPDCFICNSPYNLIIDKPWLTGVNRNEGALKVAWYIIRPELLKSYEADPPSVLPESIMYTNTTTEANRISNAIVEKYKHSNLSDIWTDGWFFSGFNAALKRSRGPVYTYLFSHRGRVTGYDLLASSGNVTLPDLGVTHSDEVLYLFDLGTISTAQDEKISRILVKLWTNFARDGRPTSPHRWPLHDERRRRYLDIGTTGVSVKSNLWPDRRAFWESIPVRNKMEAMHL